MEYLEEAFEEAFEEALWDIFCFRVHLRLNPTTCIQQIVVI